MVAMYYLAIIRKNSFKPVILCSASELSSFGFFQKGSVKEFMRFSSMLLIGRTDPEEKVSVKEQMYVCHAFVRPDNLAAVAVTDDEYPTATAHACLNYLLEQFTLVIQEEVWATTETRIEYSGIKEILTLYKDPSKHWDTLHKVQNELDETKIILHNTIETILQRGENLDDLVNKTEELSNQSKAYYKTARKTNNCCSGL